LGACQAGVMSEVQHPLGQKHHVENPEESVHSGACSRIPVPHGRLWQGQAKKYLLRVSSQTWHQQRFVLTLWIPAPQSVLLFLYVALGWGESVPGLSGRLTASGSERNCAHCWSDRGCYTFKTLPPEPSVVKKFLHQTAI